MAQIKAVIFDVYRTILELYTDETRISAYDTLSSWLSLNGVVVRSDELYNFYHNTASAMLSKVPHEHPDIDVRDIFSQIVEEFKTYEVHDTVINQACMLFRALTTVSLDIYPHVIEVINELEKNYKLAVVSDTQRAFTVPEFKKFGLLGKFEVMVFSSDVGCRKPNQLIFNEAIKQLNFLPEEVVLIGDNLFADVWGAQQIGMHGIWLDRGTEIELPDHIKKVKTNFALPGHDFLALPDLIKSI